MKRFLDKYPGGIHSSAFNNIFITSDTHFGHVKILDFEPIREELRLAEGFTGTADEFLIHKWNSQVADGDLVIHLGDLHWKSILPYVDKINGTILLVLGNHDMKPQYYEKFPNIYTVDGVWDLDGAPKEYYTGVDDKLLSAFIYHGIMFSHYPIYNIEHEYNYQRNSKIIDRMVYLHEVATVQYEEPLLNVHGHLHSACPEGTVNSVNVCIDFNRYNLLNFREVIRRVKEK